MLQLTTGHMAPQAVADPRIALDFELVGFVLVALQIKLGIQVTLPDPILKQRARRNQLMNLRQWHDHFLAIDHPDHARTCRLQAFADQGFGEVAFDQ